MVKEKVVRVSFAVNAPLRQVGVLRDVSIAIGERAGADQFRLPRRLVGVLTVQVHVLPFTHPKHRCHLPSHKSRAASSAARLMATSSLWCVDMAVRYFLSKNVARQSPLNVSRRTNLKPRSRMVLTRTHAVSMSETVCIVRSFIPKMCSDTAFSSLRPFRASTSSRVIASSPPPRIPEGPGQSGSWPSG